MISKQPPGGNSMRKAVVDDYQILFESPLGRLKQKLSDESGGQNRCPACEHGSLSFDDHSHYVSVECTSGCRQVVILACGYSGLSHLFASPLHDAVEEIEQAIELFRGFQPVWCRELNSTEIAFEVLSRCTIEEILQLRHKLAIAQWRSANAIANAKLFDWQAMVKSLLTLHPASGRRQWGN